MTILRHCLIPPCSYFYCYKVNTCSYWLGWLIPPLLSLIYFAPILLGDLKFKEGRNNFCFCRKIFVDPPQEGVSPPKSGNSKFSELYVVGTLNLCLKTPGTMQKESDQSDHPVLRKRPNREELVE